MRMGRWEEGGGELKMSRKGRGGVEKSGEERKI